MFHVVLMYVNVSVEADIGESQLNESPLIKPKITLTEKRRIFKCFLKATKQIPGLINQINWHSEIAKMYLDIDWSPFNKTVINLNSSTPVYKSNDLNLKMPLIHFMYLISLNQCMHFYLCDPVTFSNIFSEFMSSHVSSHTDWCHYSY